MTLKEKFRQELTGHLSDEKTEVDVNIATRIAEEFAIGFAKFIETKCIKTEYLHQYIFEEKEHHITSLLEIYKKKDYDTKRRTKTNLN